MNINDSFNAFKNYIIDALGPLIQKSYSHWEPLEIGNKNTAIFLPDKDTLGETYTHTVIIWISVFETDADKIAETQRNMAQKLFEAVRGGTDGVLQMTLNEIEYFDPTSQAPNIGLLRVSAGLVLDYITDCD
jgi:hypothetical protein